MRQSSLMTFAIGVSLLVVGLVGAEEPAAVKPHLGLSTRAPTPDEAQSFELERKVRYRGQVVDGVEPGSPAGAAGLKVGDVLLSLDQNDLYSFDDVRDFVATSVPGKNVAVRVKRKGSTATEVVTLELGKRKLSQSEAGRDSFAWDFSSLAQLEPALQKAKAEKKLLLVGISGAET